MVLPAASVLETLFMSILDSRNLELPESTEASFKALARGGMSTEFVFLTCYVDYNVSEYLLGSGPSQVTVAYDRLAEAKSYDLYSRAHAAGESGGDVLGREEEYEAALDLIVWGAEGALIEVVEGHEGVIFLAPMGAHNAIAIEAWQAVAQWDLQTDGAGTVNAVRYGTPANDPEYSQTLANLKSRVTAAATTDSFADDRIANVSGLTQYYRDIGAYGDIAPGDGETTTLTPSQPPAVYAPTPASLTATASGEATGHVPSSGVRVRHRVDVV